MKAKKWIMSVFGLNHKVEEPADEDPMHTMIIPRGTNVNGRIIGNDSVHVDGYLSGDVKVNNIVIIGKTGELYGNIKAQRVIINGKYEGNITADRVEIFEHGRCNGEIQANKILVKGYCEGKLLCGGLFIDAGGEVYSNAQIKKVVVAGILEGNIACKELRTLPTCVLRGKMFADHIQNEGGRIEGYLGKYSEMAKTNAEMAYYLRIFNSRNDYILLEAKEYHVDVEEELNEEKSSQTHTSEEPEVIIVAEAKKEE